MIIGIHVFSDSSNVTFTTAEDVGLVSYDSGVTPIASLHAYETAVVPLGKGLYRIKTGSQPTVTGDGSDVVITSSKDPPSDPTLMSLAERLQAIYPDLTAESLDSFISDPDAKGVRLA